VDWSQVLTLVTAVVGATWLLRSKLSDIERGVSDLRLELTRLDGRVVSIESAKGLRGGHRR